MACDWVCNGRTLKVREHEAVDVRLTPLRPLPVVLPNDRRAVPQDVGHLLERGALLQEPRSESMAIPVGVRVLDAGFLEYRRERPLRDSDYGPPGAVAVPIKVRAVQNNVGRSAGGLPREQVELVRLHQL